MRRPPRRPSPRPGRPRRRRCDQHALRDNEAVAKSRKAAARAARTHSRVYLTGCGANLPKASLGALPDNVTVVVAKRSEETAEFVATDVGAIGCTNAAARLDRVRAFVKIQDGCSFSCGFCVIPLVRGSSRSRRASAVLAEIRRRVDQGHREVVLTGINLGCFRDRDAGYDLARLVREAGAVEGLDRLRLSSIEINHVNDELVAALRETPAVGEHLHVPLQSGDDGVLHAMGRRYAADRYVEKIAPLAEGFNVTSDVIVGFPTEDAAAFENTLATVRRAGISRVHVFPYSPRPGTSDGGRRRCRPGQEEGAGGPAARTVLRARSGDGGNRKWDAMMSSWSTVPGAVTGRTTRHISWTEASATSFACTPQRWPRKGSSVSQRDDCLFCRHRSPGGTYIASTDGFVAINDINPRADVHVLIIPKRHIDTFRDIAEFPADEAKRMLEFIADTAKTLGLDRLSRADKRRARRGQTIFHLHWHLLGGGPSTEVPAEFAAAVAEA